MKTFNYITLLLLASLSSPANAEIDLTQVPLFLTNNGKANVLMLLSNANTMELDAASAGVGSSSEKSKSEIARNAMKTIIAKNIGKVNMGLLAFEQYTPDKWYLSSSAHDVSYNPADYDPSFTGPRNSQTKKYRQANPHDYGNYIHYNSATALYNENFTDTVYCYSSTACTDPSHDFRGTSQSGCSAAEDAANGPWDTYQCYGIKVGTSNNGIDGHYNYLYDTILSSAGSSLARGVTDFGHHISGFFVGRTWYNNQAPGGGYLHVPLKRLDSTQVTALNYKLATSNPDIDSNAPTDPLRPLQNSGLQPLEGTILTANHYFNNNGLPANQRSGPIDPVPESCDQNYLVMLTDGLPSATKNGTPSADVTANLNGMVTETTALLNSPANVKSYVVGFALPYGINPNQLDIVAQAGGTNTAYNANDPDSLNAAFTSIFSNIAAQVVGAAASVASDSGSLRTDSSIFQAKFDATDWTGELRKIPIAQNGSLGSASWEASEKLDVKLASDRVILTYKPSNNKGIAFRWPASESSPSATELDPAQIDTLNQNSTGIVDNNGEARLDFLRGETTNEGANGLKFRARASKLGDIVNSAPMYVGPPALNISDPSYASFKSSRKNRKKVVYVGANDGMLHAFSANTGEELFAYAPAALYEHLPKLTAGDYTHHYFVDSSANVSDVYWGSSWKSILVSGMGHGAKGIFALNVTNPNNFTETKANNVVRFEFPKANTNNNHAKEVGYISGKIPIVKLNDGNYGAIFGNGYNAGGSGKASLFVVNIKNGNVLKRLSTGVGSKSDPNGLANPVVVDVDGNNTADYVYAGDLKGNMWKFDLSSASRGGWKRDYKLFKANQAITHTPDVSLHPQAGYMVYFGTGKYLESSDISDTSSNHFYGIWDHFDGTVNQGDLIAQTVTATSTINGNQYRFVTQNTVDYTGGSPDKGWQLSLPTLGERTVSDPVVRSGRVIFTTLIPSLDTCSTGGSSWLMELDFLTGGMPSYQVLDTNGDAIINATDQIVSGLGSNHIISTPVIISDPVDSSTSTITGSETNGNRELKYINQSDGSVEKVIETGSGVSSRRSSWRQIINF